MAKWIKCSERLPRTPADTDTTFLVAVKRAHNGKTYVFAAEWLNEKLLNRDCEDDPEDGVPFNGWHLEQTHDDFSEYFVPLIDTVGDEVTHWQALPRPPRT